MKQGVAVFCGTCGLMKKPQGRSVPLGCYHCDSNCSGYYQDPKPGDLWPGETEAESGYPVSEHAATEETNHA